MRSVLNLTLIYNDLRAVIPAKAGIEIKKTGFRIRSGMTKYVKLFPKHYTRRSIFNELILWLVNLPPSKSKEALFGSLPERTGLSDPGHGGYHFSGVFTTFGNPI